MKPILSDYPGLCAYPARHKFHCLPIILVMMILIGATSTIKAQTGPAGVGNSTINKIWLKADAGFTQASNTAVASWPDQSGNGFSAHQGTAAKRPIYRANFLNGNPVILFDRTNGNKYLDITASGVSSLVNNSNTIYVVGVAWAGGTDNSTNMYQGLVVIPGWHSGIFFHLHLSKHFAVQPELMYSAQGAEHITTTTETQLELGYLNLPILFLSKMETFTKSIS